MKQQFTSEKKGCIMDSIAGKKREAIKGCFYGVG
jgi:hypothetical protein